MVIRNCLHLPFLYLSHFYTYIYRHPSLSLFFSCLSLFLILSHFLPLSLSTSCSKLFTSILFPISFSSSLSLSHFFLIYTYSSLFPSHIIPSFLNLFPFLSPSLNILILSFYPFLSHAQSLSLSILFYLFLSILLFVHTIFYLSPPHLSFHFSLSPSS